MKTAALVAFLLSIVHHCCERAPHRECAPSSPELGRGVCDVARDGDVVDTGAECCCVGGDADACYWTNPASG